MKKYDINYALDYQKCEKMNYIWSNNIFTKSQKKEKT
jgi:hypothetical protein